MEELIDHTLLNKNATTDQLCQFVKRGINNKVVAICVYPEALPVIYKLKEKSKWFPKICTVINFPHGKGTKSDVFKELNKFDLQFVDEIDVVWNYHSWGTCGIGYDVEEAIAPISAVVEWCEIEEAIRCHIVTIKVILETGYLNQFEEENNLQNAINTILLNFYDSIHFLKTSTGKTEFGGASIEAVTTMINSIKKLDLENKIGIKVSGGINTKDQIYDYLYLFEEYNWKGKIRFGSSKILES